MTFSTAAAGRVRRRNNSSVRLDVPVSGRTLLPRPDREAFARVAEVIARFIGTARFLVIQTVVVLIWIALNVMIPFMRWDPYPFILLNLAFSTQAAYAAPLILLAQNRQDDRDRASLTEDRAAATRMREDTEFLAREVAALRLGVADAATRQYVRGELAHQLDALRSDLEILVRSAVRTSSAPNLTAQHSPAQHSGAPNSGAPNSGARNPTAQHSTAQHAVAAAAAAAAAEDRDATATVGPEDRRPELVTAAARGVGARQGRPQPAPELLVPTGVRSPRARSSRSGRRGGGRGEASNSAVTAANGTSKGTSHDWSSCENCGSPKN